jgi:hypothetical protein
MDTCSGNGDIKKFVTETRSAKELWASIGKRFLEMLIKLISVKGFCLAEITVLVILKIVPWQALIIIMAAVIGGKIGQLVIDKVK